MKNPGEVPSGVVGAFYILGICEMLPWNFLITANSYWQYKLRNLTLGEEWDAPGTPSTSLQVSFTPALVIISHVVYLILTFATSTITRWIGENERIFGSLILSLFTMGTFTILAIVNTDHWQTVFYGISLALVALLYAGIAIMQASLFGIAGHFSDKCMKCMVSGQSIAGIISSLAQIISLAIGKADPIVSAVLYFFIASVFVAITISSFMHLIRSEFYQNSYSAKNGISVTTDKAKLSFREYSRILRKVIWIGVSMGNILLVTLAIFPAVQVYVTSTHTGTAWGDIYFQPTITFLLFNVMDMVGREVALHLQWPSHKGWKVHMGVVCRIAFIPLILLCHGDNKSFITIFNDDIYYIIINALFALTNGYFMVLCLMYYPRFVTEEETDVAGAMMAMLLGVGMVVGSSLTPGFVSIWGPKHSISS